MITVRPRRSALYMPASNVRALEKAKTIAADTLIFDLEDAVAPRAKEAARAQACQAARPALYGGREIVIRVNGLGTPWGEADVAAVAHSQAHALLLPKAETASDIAALRALLDDAGARPELALWAMIETPHGVLNVRDIAAAAAGNRFPLAAFVLGTNDLAKATRALQTPDRLPMLAWMSACILAARAYDVDILDSVYNDYRDLHGFARECAQARALGFDGKTCIHPDQVAPCNRAFSPPEEEVAWARKVIAAFDDPANQGRGVITIDGRMVELMHRDMARRTVAIADAIAAMPGP